MGLSTTSCSWLVNLIVANDSSEDIFVRYILPTDSVNSQFYKTPKVYKYDKGLLKLRKLDEGKRPKNIPADVKTIEETRELEVRLKPGQTVHVGFYLSFQPRHEVISKNDLKVLVGKDWVLTAKKINEALRRWKNIRTDLLQVE